MVEWAREHVAFAVRGNHDRACTDFDGIEDFSPLAREAAIWTHSTLSSENANYLRELPQGPVTIEDFAIVHGSPRNEDEYLVHNYEAADAFLWISERITFLRAHHICKVGFEIRRGKVNEIPRDAQEFLLKDDAGYLVNPGSVGQPRDLNAMAAYSLFSPEDDIVMYRRVPYALDDTQRKILNVGLPHLLADRLAIGK